MKSSDSLFMLVHCILVMNGSWILGSPTSMCLCNISLSAWPNPCTAPCLQLQQSPQLAVSLKQWQWRPIFLFVYGFVYLLKIHVYCSGAFGWKIICYILVTFSTYDAWLFHCYVDVDLHSNWLVILVFVDFSAWEGSSYFQLLYWLCCTIKVASRALAPLGVLHL